MFTLDKTINLNRKVSYYICSLVNIFTTFTSVWLLEKAESLTSDKTFPESAELYFI